MASLKLFILFAGVCFANAFQSMPHIKGNFLGCFAESTGTTTMNKRVDGVRRSTGCIEACLDQYYRYAFVRMDESCVCSNFLGDFKSSDNCKKFCKNCDTKEQDQLLDVYNTANNMNGPPMNFNAANVTDTAAILTWQPPESAIRIENYKLIATVIKTYSQSQPPKYFWTNLYANDTYRVHVLTLHPATTYNLSLQGDGFHVEGAKTHLVIKTLIGEPDAIPISPYIMNKNESTITVRMDPVYNNNGPVTSYLVVVIDANSVQPVETENLKSYSTANAEGTSYYVTAELQPNVKENTTRNTAKEVVKDEVLQRIGEVFTIGDGKVYGKYFNAPLQKDHDYHVMVGMVSRADNREFIVFSEAASQHVDVIMSHMPTQEAQESSTIVVLLSLAIVVISLLLVIGLIAFYFLRNRVVLNHRQRLNDNQELTMQGPMIDVENNGYIPEEELPQSSSNHLQTLSERVWQIPRGDLDIGQSVLVGYGRFGRVHAGSVTRTGQSESVHVYCVSDRKLQPSVKRNMLKELDVLIRAGEHAHILRLIGTCDRVDCVAIVLESTTMTLKEHLLAGRVTTGNAFASLIPATIIEYAYGIARGMDHLHTRKIVHKELCASNVRVMHTGSVKIAGFGLSKYHKSETAPSMARHAAREMLRGQEATTKSDVWAFAVTLWELCTLGATPYGRIAKDELREKILKGNYMLPQVPYVFDTLYQVMLNCWQLDWDERPTFAELAEHIDFIRNEDCLSFTMYAGFQYEPHCAELEFDI